MTVRIGMVGAGIIAHRHLVNLAGMSDVELVGIADVAPEKAAAYAEEFGTRSFETAEQMVDVTQPDALYICIPPFAHGAPEMLAVECGLPFFVEKPLAVDLPTAEAIGDAVERAGLITAVGHHWRYLDTIDQVRNLLRGYQVRLAQGYWLDFTPPPTWWTTTALSGGQMIEQTIHIVDLARYLVGEVTAVYGAATHHFRPNFPQSDLDDVSAAILHFENGALGVISSTHILHYPYRIGLWLYAEDLVVECRETEVIIERPDDDLRLEPQVDPFQLEDRAFVDAVASGDRSSIRVPYAEALKTHRLVCAAMASAREQVPLSLAKTKEVLR